MNPSLWLSLLLFFTPVKKDIPASVYDIKIAAFKGNEIDLAAYKGKKILIVNAPAMSVDDEQYAELETLYKKYSDKLVVIGVLADDFNIAPGTKVRGVDYHKNRYRVTFPLGDKASVRAPDMAPVFEWLTEKKYNNFKDSHVKWNFQKYLVNEQGELVAVFDPKVRPLSHEVTAAIEK